MNPISHDCISIELHCRALVRMHSLALRYQGACDWTTDGSCKLTRHIQIDTSQASATELAGYVVAQLGLHARSRRPDALNAAAWAEA